MDDRCVTSEAGRSSLALMFGNHDPLPDLSRRTLLKAAGAVLLLPACGTMVIAGEQESPVSSFSYDDFLAFSRAVVQSEKLDDATARRLYKIFQKEPWGIDHIQRVQRKIAKGGTEAAIATLSSGERWFLVHFLTTWITGIYYHESGNIMVTFNSALMHRALEDIRPVPGNSQRQFGFWSEPPAYLQ